VKVFHHRLTSRIINRAVTTSIIIAKNSPSALGWHYCTCALAPCKQLTFWLPWNRVWPAAPSVCAYLLFWLRIQVCNALQCLCGSNCAARWTHQCLVYNSPFKCWEWNCLMPIIWWQQKTARGRCGWKGASRASQLLVMCSSFLYSAKWKWKKGRPRISLWVLRDRRLQDSMMSYVTLLLHTVNTVHWLVFTVLLKRE
jgi:hypothetical protein